MNLIQKIKSYFIKYEFYSWKDFNRDEFDLRFTLLNDEMLLDIGSYFKNNLAESKQIGNKRHRLKDELANCCASLDELLPLIKNIVDADYKETLAESIEYKWDFEYFVGAHKRCENTICISNSLTSLTGPNGTCVYPLATIRKYNGNYYCWNHLNRQSLK